MIEMSNPEVIGLMLGLLYMIFFVWFPAVHDDRREK